MKKQIFVEDSPVYAPYQIMEVLKLATCNRQLTGDNKGTYYYNIPCSFDIETTSFYRDEYGIQYDYKEVQHELEKDSKAKFEKVAIMYIWQFGINGRVIIGRTWEEFTTMCDVISSQLDLDKKRKLIIYVHNLSFEFQFLCKRFQWSKVFSLDVRKPIYATTTRGIEFRCSYLLSGYSLAKLGEQLHKYKVQKMVGDLDYSLLRNSETPLTDKEIQYCINDVRVVMAYIQEKIEDENGIQNIPLTKTGYVRQYCRNKCLYRYGEDGRAINYDYKDCMQGLTISGTEEYNLMKRAFAGGFTHANAYYVGDTINDVASYDFTSSYPAVMIAEKFPMSAGKRVKITSKEQFEEINKQYCTIFDIAFYNLLPKSTNENPLSVSKCFKKEDIVENNGRIVSAKLVCTTITNVDYDVLKMFYTWEHIQVNEVWIYRKEYLPTEFVKAILELYQMKTQLKNVKGKEVEYLKSKEMLNSCYGMTVTDFLRDEIVFNEEWTTEHMDEYQMENGIEKYNHSKNRFLFYPWGIFVTAYARKNLFTGIYAVGDDYIYSDTDSIKLKNYEAHKTYFEGYNMIVTNKLKQACKYHNIPFEMTAPKTIKGVEKPLGVWDFEGVYDTFKTLGAKRYMVKQSDVLEIGGKKYNYSLTVSGMNKIKAIPYLLDKYGENLIFEAFDNFLEVPPEGTGKNIHTYIDYEIDGNLVDYTGHEAKYHELSCTHLEATGYTMNLFALFLDYLRGIKYSD